MQSRCIRHFYVKQNNPHLFNRNVEMQFAVIVQVAIRNYLYHRLFQRMIQNALAIDVFKTNEVIGWTDALRKLNKHAFVR
jgi:hypothetical protein